MRVSLRTEKISKGRESFYLDVYIDQNQQYQKRLKMYLIPVKSPADKIKNKQVQTLAEVIRNKYELDLLNNKHGRTDVREKYDQNFINFFDSLVAIRYENGVNFHTWECIQKYLHRYTKRSLHFDDMTESWLEAFKSYLLTKISYNSAHGYFNIIKRAVHQAFREKLIDTDPAFNVKAPKYSHPKREFLTEEEVKEICKHGCKYPVLKKAFLFSIMTGLRWSDVQKLKWKEVVNQDEQAFLVFTMQKTQEAERLPIHQDALTIIGERKDDEERVFKGLKYSAYHNVELQRWMLSAGITKKITFHCSRHTHATLLINKGVDIFTVSMDNSVQLVPPISVYWCQCLRFKRCH